MKYFRILLITILCVAELPLAGATGRSQGFAIAVTPAKLELEMKPGSTYNLPITLRNSAPTATHIQSALADFALTQDGSYVFESVGKRPYSLLRYASINPREFDLGPGMTEQVRLSLNVPDKALSGEYAGIVLFQTRATRHAGAVAFAARVTTKLYMTIPGTVRIEGAIVKMNAARSPIGELYRVMFKNVGNAHVYLRGQVQVLKGGEIVDRVQMPDSMLVERGGERLIEVNGKSLPSGQYQAIATVDYGGKTMTGGEIAFDVK